MRLLSYILNVCLSVQDLIAPFQIIIPSGLITLCIVSIQPSTVTVMPSAHESSGIDGVVQGVQNRAGCKGPFDARVYLGQEHDRAPCVCASMRTQVCRGLS